MFPKLKKCWKVVENNVMEEMDAFHVMYMNIKEKIQKECGRKMGKKHSKLIFKKYRLRVHFKN